MRKQMNGEEDWELKPTMDTPEHAFWKWFLQLEGDLLHFEGDMERIFNELAAELGKVDRNLCFEFGPCDERREFVISAGGIKASFSAAVSLAKAAPPLDHWRITAFRPRRPTLNRIEIRGKCVDPDDVQVALLDNGKIAGIYLFIPNFHEDAIDLKQIGYLMLDEALGEFDVETRVGLIKMLPLNAQTDVERYPLTELPRLFDQLVARLEDRSEEPS